MIEQEGKGELQGGLEATQRRFRGGSEGAVEATTLGIENQVRLKAQLYGIQGIYIQNESLC